MSNKDIFNNIYINREWGPDSGTGSIPGHAIPYINYVNNFIKGYRIKTILDLGSGDTNMLRSLDLKNIESYKCIEVSDHAIKTYYNKLPNCVEVINDDIITCEYPKVDLILIKDVLQHLNYESIKNIMQKIFNNCKYAIITNDILLGQSNTDINNGAYRGINLKIDPFNYSDLQIIKTYKSFQEIKSVSLYRNKNEII